MKRIIKHTVAHITYILGRDSYQYKFNANINIIYNIFGQQFIV